jgi:DNA polymerase-1
MLLEGIDPHLNFASLLLGIPYEDCKRIRKDKNHPRHADVEDARQIGKAFNFGKPGGLGNKKFCRFAKKSYGLEITIERAKELTEIWYRSLPEMRAYFARVNALCESSESGRADVETLFTERHRGQATYCAACNNGFQALGSDCAKHAAWLLAKAMYVERDSLLFNSRAVAFVHDEFILETDDGPGAHDAAFELARLMVEGANKYLPDVPIALSKMEPTLMGRWSKNATQCFDTQGRLVPWS